MTAVDNQEPEFSRIRLILGIGLWVGGLTSALGGIAWFSPTAREVLKDALFYGIAFFGTPFVLEMTVAVIGLLTVLTISHWRIQKEGDGWVYLPVPDPAQADDVEHSPETMLGKDEVKVSDDLEARLAAIEGFLDLGLPQDALEALDQLDAGEQALKRAAELRHRAQTHGPS